MAPQTPEACNELFVEYLNAGNLDGLVELYEPEGSHVREDGTAAQGREAVREVLQAFLAMEPKLKLTEMRVVPGGRELAVLYDAWRMSASGPEGKPMEMQGTGLHVLRRQDDGSWRYAITALSNGLA